LAVLASLSDMRSVSAVVAAIALAVVPALPAAAAEGTAGEKITSYDVRLAVQRDGSMQVQETIAYDFGTHQRHGIDRDIDTEQRYDGSHNRRYPVSDVTVSSADAPAQVQVSGGGSETSLRIGDPDRTVTGSHTYRISYTVAAATTRLPDHDELYWNAVGPGWSVPVEDITVQVSGEQVTKATCFAGPPGGTAGCRSAQASGPSATYRGDSLAPGDVLTVVAAFPPGTVATAAPVLTDRLTVRRFAVGNGAYAVPLVLLFAGGPLFLLLRGRRRKRAQEEPALAYRSQYQPQPPAGMRPLLANMLLSGTFRTVDPVAVLLDLSARGYLSITPLSKRDWRLVAARPPDGSLRPEEQEVLRAAFAKSPDTTLSAAGRAVARIRGRLRGIARTAVVEQGWYRRPPGERSGLVAVGILMIVVALPLTFLLGFLVHAALAGPALAVGGALMIAYALTRPAPRTEAGEIARSQLMAFKQTLAGIDPGRFPPEQREAALGGLLPYAVVLGLAPQLASAFLAAGVVAGGYAYTSNPMWWSTFATDATSATASSSSGGSSSGFSGGSSGGGGGGGGGGSW
jgi:uncharacterized membrane protein YgcG